MGGKSKSKQRPGIICYFDSIPTLEKLSEVARGRFLMACLYYGRDMEEVSFDDLGLEDRIRLETLWEQVRPRIDSDGQGWADAIIQRSFAGYCSACERSGENPMTFEDYRKWYLRKQEVEGIT